MKTKCLCGRLWDIDDSVDEKEAVIAARHGVPECTECCHPSQIKNMIREE